MRIAVALALVALAACSGGERPSIGDPTTSTTAAEVPAELRPFLEKAASSATRAFTAEYTVLRKLGSTTSTVLDVRGAAANRNGSWNQASVDLSGFAGQTVRIQVEAADASSASSVVEAGVDEVRVTRR